MQDSAETYERLALQELNRSMAVDGPEWATFHAVRAQAYATLALAAATEANNA